MSRTTNKKGGSQCEPETALSQQVGRDQDTAGTADFNNGTPAEFDPEIAFFPSVSAKGAGRNGCFREFLRQVREGRYRKQIEDLRAVSDPKAYENQKKRLPAFLLSASTANGGALVSDLALHSGILQVDIDKLPSRKEAETLRDRMRDDHYALAAFLSPGGLGVKVLIRVAASFDLHPQSFLAAQARFKVVYGVEIDGQCKNLNRFCYVSYDPDLVENLMAAILPVRSTQKEEGTPCRGGSGRGSSSPSILETSPPTLPLPPPSPLHYTGKLFQEFPRLEKVYASLVERQFAGFQGGTHNEALCDMVPFLLSAIHPRFVPGFLEEFHRQNAQLICASLEEHLWRGACLVSGTLASYPDRLSPEEASHYAALKTEDGRAAYRICRSLAQQDRDDVPCPEFFLSGSELASRLGSRWEKDAHDILQAMIKRGILELLDRGKARTKGEKGKARRLRWALPIPEAQDPRLTTTMEI